jgi:GTP cyclohydrolase II
MLTALGVVELDLLTNNPDQAQQLRDLGVAVRFIRRTGVFATNNNIRYLHAKAQHTRHTIALPETATVTALAC